MSDTLPTYGASASLTAYYSPGGDNGQSTSYGFAPPYPVALPAMAYVEDGGGASATASASVGTTPEVTASAEASELPAQDNGIVDGDAVVSVQSADSDEAARVHRSDAARRSNLMAPTILS
jgi:hypothetical protein